jgi:ABC-type branched-subunit amino acid transport system ATPase component
MNTNNGNLLITKDLTIHFGGLVAVDHVDIEVKRNTIMGLIGPNGSGKTTIFNMITGLYTPTSGEIFFNGESLIGKPAHEIARKGVARTFQTSRLCLDLSVLDNVFIGMHSRQRQGLFSAVFNRKLVAEEVGEAREKAFFLLNTFNPELVKRAGEPAGRLPQIDRRRVEICRAMAADPRLLLLDEPSAGMTPEEIEELMADIRKVQQASTDITIVIVEHVMSVIRSITEHVVVLNFGRKIAEGSFHEVASRQEVLEAYLGKRGGAA